MKHVLFNNAKYRIGETKFNGAVVSMDGKEFEKMRVRGPAYLQSDEFAPDSISYVHYDEERGVCELDEETCSGKVGRVLLATIRYLPPSTSLFAFRPKSRKYKVELAAAEFKIDDEGNAVHAHDIPSTTPPQTPESSESRDYASLRLSAKAAKYLMGLPMGGIEVAGESQREIAGDLKATRGADGVGILSLNGSTTGTVKTVSLNKLAPYTYHSHPEDAYRMNGVGVGFPSAKDYTIFFVNKKMKAHFVAAIEGLYIMTRGREDVGADVSATEFRQILEDSFVTSKTNGMTGTEHAKAITDIGFFRVVFVEWEDREKIIKIE
jgi:hypothetical protein